MEDWQDILDTFFLKIGIVCAIFLLVVILGYWLQLHLYYYRWILKLTRSPLRVKSLYNFYVPMKEGTILLTDVYLPKKKGKYPALILRTPYGKNNPEHNYGLLSSIFACQGYAVVVQDVRGKYGSEGTFHPFIHEEKDGKDTIEWVVKQPWSDGQVALLGFSYLGTAAWLAAPDAPAAVRTIAPMFCCQNAYTGWIDRGVPYLKDILYWLSKHHGRRGRAVTHDEVDNIILQLPVLQFDKRLKEGIDTFKTWMSHLQEDTYWRSFSVNHRRDSINIPILFIGGWYDRFIHNMINDYNKTVVQRPESAAAQSQMVIGPWAHIPGLVFPGVNFGKTARFQNLFSDISQWFDKWLKKSPSREEVVLPIKYFMMGKNEWRLSATWPPHGVIEKKYYLDSGGKANSAQGDGALLPVFPEEVKADHYVYDPEKPVPSIGNKMLYGNHTEGPKEQAEVTSRNDVLVYVSGPLKESFEMAGPVLGVLYVASNALDTDFCMKLCDVHPNGKAYYLLSAFVRMRFLDSVSVTHGIDPDKVYRVEFHLGHTAHTFMKGHRFQLQVASADFPNHERNLNTGGSNEGDSREIKANQTIYHGGRYDSHIVLPHLQELQKRGIYE